MKQPLTRTEARILLRKNTTTLDKALDEATSQFQVRLAYVTAHEELVTLAREIIKAIPEDDHK